MNRHSVSIAQLGPDAVRQVVAQVAAQQTPKRKNKFGAVRTKFKSTQGFELVAASKAEARDYAMLDHGIKAGLVKSWAPQVSFKLPGGTVYRCDALVFWADGRVTVRDVKGMETQAFTIKRRLMKSTYGIDVEVVK